MPWMFQNAGYNSNVFILNLYSFYINNLSVNLTTFANNIGASNIIFGSGWENANMSEISFHIFPNAPINIYYTDINFPTWNIGNMNYWNTWRGIGNTTFIAGLPG